MCADCSFSSFFPLPANAIDVLRVLEMSDDMEGVSMEAGLCTSRKGMEETDLAYRIDKKIQLSAPTKQLFPGSEHFSFRLHKATIPLQLIIWIFLKCQNALQFGIFVRDFSVTELSTCEI